MCIRDRYETREVYPAPDDIFNAFAFTPLKDVKVVILGQDPYHEPGQAHGLCFSVRPEVDTPPSLVNIYKAVSYTHLSSLILGFGDACTG